MKKDFDFELSFLCCLSEGESWTQQELAQACNVSISAIAYIEKCALMKIRKQMQTDSFLKELAESRLNHGSGASSVSTRKRRRSPAARRALARAVYVGRWWDALLYRQQRWARSPICV